MKHQYLFITGNHHELSRAEITSLLPAASIIVDEKNILIIETDTEISNEYIHTLGGIIKIGFVHKTSSSLHANEILPLLPAETHKTIFGISFYPETKQNAYLAKKIGYEIKNIMKERGQSSRLVNTKQATLSSVTVEKNKLLTKGAEIIIIKHENTYFYATTLAVQDFEQYSLRDFGRPSRDDRSGMLPPKLAQILINLSGPNNSKTLLDPFCGSGTILQEAMLMGYKKIIGSDISSQAISDTKHNLQWLQHTFPIQNDISIQLYESSIQNLQKTMHETDIHKIIFEGYLGPTLPHAGRINKIITELTELYAETFKIFEQLLEKNGIIVAALPAWSIENKKYFLPIEKIITPSLKQKNMPGQTPRHTFIYSRPYQTVQREIFILTKTQ